MVKSMHLEYFFDAAVPDVWPSNGIRTWVRQIAGDDIADCLPSENFDRATLKELALPGSGCPTEAVMWAVLAWGKMHRRHAKTFYNCNGEAIEICDRIRKIGINRLESFDLFNKSLDTVHGITAAFFTKLMFFISKTHDGYIMDQWTGKSVNLIFDKEIVILERSGHVSKKNCVDNYAEFCRSIDWLAQQYPIESPMQPVDGEWIEMALFSRGGRKAAKWRKYVRENYEI